MNFIDSMLFWLARAAAEFLIVLAVLGGFCILGFALYLRDERLKAKRQSKPSGRNV
jgi:hypothetical protein